MADRNFFGYKRWKQMLGIEPELLWRIRKNLLRFELSDRNDTVSVHVGWVSERLGQELRAELGWTLVLA